MVQFFLCNIIKLMRKLLTKFDLFPASPTLRAEGQAEVVNLCGSIFSLLVFSAFVYVFISTVVGLVKYQDISATQILTMDRPSDQPIKNIMISVGLFNSSILQVRSIFQLHAYTTDRSLIPSPIGVFPCQRQMWPMFDDKKYSTLNLQHNLCIQTEGVQIFGSFGQPQAKFIILNLTICNNATSPVTCASPAYINGFFATHMMWNRFIPISVILLDTGISATKKDPLTYTAYEKTLFLLVNLKQQTFVQTFIGSYQIHTDTSFLPFVQQQLATGYFVNQCILTTIINYLNLPIFLQFYIFPSPTNRIINRSYGKFDAVLSYVGGLYGIVISLIAFFLLSFNQYKYQLRVSQGAFTFRDGHLAKEGDLHFLKYIKYVFYDWVKMLFCVQLNWKDCKAIDQARSQAVQQIDVRHLLKRISHLQKVITAFVTKQNQKVLYMAQSNSIQQVKNRRSIVEYCHKFIMADNCPTISTFQDLQAIASYSLGSYIKTQSALIFPAHKLQNQMQTIPKEQENGTNLTNTKNSISLMDQYVQKYITKYQINQNSFDITEEEKQTQKQLAEAFFGIDQATRLSLIKKIPLGLLYRINLQKNIEQKQKPEYLQLSIDNLQRQTKQLRRKRKKKQKSQPHLFQDMDKTLQLKE